MELNDASEEKEKQFLAVMDEILQKHQREIDELKSHQEDGDVDRRLEEIEQGTRLEINRVRDMLLQESEERIAENQRILLQQINLQEQELNSEKQKACSLEGELTGVTKDRDRLLHEVQVLTETRHAVDKERIPVNEPVIGKTIRQVVQEEPILAASSVDQVEGLPPGFEPTQYNTELPLKIQQMEDIIHEKSTNEMKLNQQLSEIRKELDKERKNAQQNLKEKENRERTLETNKERLEMQLSALERDSYDSVQELGMMQERLQEKERVVEELKEEKSKLLSLLKENNDVFSREKDTIVSRSKQQELIIKVKHLLYPIRDTPFDGTYILETNLNCDCTTIFFCSLVSCSIIGSEMVLNVVI